MVMLKLPSCYDAVSEPIFGKFQKKKKTQIDRELYLIEKGGCLPFIVLIIVHLMPKVEWMFTYCVLEDSKLVQLLDVGIDKVFPWTELYVYFLVVILLAM